LAVTSLIVSTGTVILLLYIN